MNSESIHTLVLNTIQGEHLLEGAGPIVESCLRNLARRYPGLRVEGYRLQPHRLELTLNLGRLDEDLARIIQSFKAEARILLKKNGLDRENYWQWGFEEL